MEITILIENEGRASLRGEHGLSMYLRYKGHTLLLDAGETGDFAQNAALLGCPLEAVEAAVLSHGHHDHGNGFPALLRLNEQIRIFARTTALEPRYTPRGNYSGLSDLMRGEFAHRFELSDSVREIFPGLWLVPDAVDHEQSLVCETADGLVVLNSCCHAGADNIVDDILARFPGKRVRALVGGFHLMGSGGVSTLGKEPDTVRAMARRLTEELGAELYTGHCTGEPAFALLEEAAPDRVRAIHTGDVLVF